MSSVNTFATIVLGLSFVVTIALIVQLVRHRHDDKKWRTNTAALIVFLVIAAITGPLAYDTLGKVLFGLLFFASALTLIGSTFALILAIFVKPLRRRVPAVFLVSLIGVIALVFSPTIPEQVFTVTIETQVPGSLLEVNGIVGETPLEVSVFRRDTLSITAHPAPGYAGITQVLECPCDPVVKIELPLLVTLEVSSDPEEAIATVRSKHDGRSLYEGPTPFTLKEVFGQVELTLEAPGYSTRHQTIDLGRNQTLHFALAIPVPVTFESIPQGAVLTVNGQRVGTTPVTVILPSGEESTYHLAPKAEIHLEQRGAIIPEGGELVSVTFQPDPAYLERQQAAEAERLAAEERAAAEERVEAERVAAEERAAAERAEAKRLAAEERVQAEERAEAERLAAEERAAAEEQAEAERVAAEQAEASRARFAEITFESDPSGATLTIDGDEVGATPVTVTLPVGESFAYTTAVNQDGVAEYIGEFTPYHDDAISVFIPRDPHAGLIKVTIWGEPVASDLYVAYDAQSELELVEASPPTVYVKPGTVIRYSLRPPADSAYTRTDGELTADSANTYHLSLNKRPAEELADIPNPGDFPTGSPERKLAEWFRHYAHQDWDAMVAISLPSQLNIRDGSEFAWNGIEGNYFFRDFRRIISMRDDGGNNVTARITVTWEHSLGRSRTPFLLLREDRQGRLSPNAPWSVSYLAAMRVENLD